MQCYVKSLFNKFKYTIRGVRFGVIFPVIATVLEIYNHALDISWQSVLQLQRESTLLWIIDSAPVILGFFAYQIDKRQNMLISQNENLEELVSARSREAI